jgi:hypothetical protein
VLPPVLAEELAEDFSWWANVQPPVGFEDQIDSILPAMVSWSTRQRMWGNEERNDAHVRYVDESMSKRIAFRIDANAISPELVRQICKLAKQLGCVLMTADYEILMPDESMVLAAIQHSTAKMFVDDPVATLRSLGRPEVQERLKSGLKDNGTEPSQKTDFKRKSSLRIVIEWGLIILAAIVMWACYHFVVR